MRSEGQGPRLSSVFSTKESGGSSGFDGAKVVCDVWRDNPAFRHWICALDGEIQIAGYSKKAGFPA
jgi:hypothetical protein